ncbi:signal peptidase complex subunit 1 [Sigmodon hispidus]
METRRGRAAVKRREAQLASAIRRCRGPGQPVALTGVRCSGQVAASVHVSSAPGSRNFKRRTSCGDGAGRGQRQCVAVGDIRFRGHGRRTEGLESATPALLSIFSANHAGTSEFAAHPDVGFIYGYVAEQFGWTVYIVMAGFAFSCLLTLPPWPIYRRHPLKWLPVQDLNTEDKKSGDRKIKRHAKNN